MKLCAASWQRKNEVHYSKSKNQLVSFQIATQRFFQSFRLSVRLFCEALRPCRMPLRAPLRWQDNPDAYACLFSAPHFFRHLFAADWCGVPVKEEAIAAAPMAVSGDAPAIRYVVTIGTGQVPCTKNV